MYIPPFLGNTHYASLEGSGGCGEGEVEVAATAVVMATLCVLGGGVHLSAGSIQLSLTSKTVEMSS